MEVSQKHTEWMTPRQVAEQLEVTPRAVIDWKGKLSCVRVGGRYRITKLDVMCFLKTGN